MQPTGQPKGAALLSTQKLDSDGRIPLYRQLATDLSVSRLTVKNVYEQLNSEGFLETRHGSGSFVTQFSRSELPPPIPAFEDLKDLVPTPMSDRLDTISQSNTTTRLGGLRAFRPGVPALDRFPRRAWAAAYSRVMRSNDHDLLGYGPTGGLLDLKRAIAAHVRDHRGIGCESEQIVITSGAQQAFVLLAAVLLKPDDIVWCEDPGHIAIRDAMRLLGADVRSVPIDPEGFDLAHAADRHSVSRRP